jgi:hypothetical protein
MIATSSDQYGQIMMDAIFSSPGDFHDGTRAPKTEGIGNCEFDPVRIIPCELSRVVKRILRDEQLSEVTDNSPEKSWPQPQAHPSEVLCHLPGPRKKKRES